MSSFSNQILESNSTFEERIQSCRSLNCIQSPPSLIFSGPRTQIDPLTASHLDRESTVAFVTKYIRQVSASHWLYPLERDPFPIGIIVDERRHNFITDIIYSPPSEVDAIREGQFAVQALAGIENRAKRELYASLVSAMSNASSDPYVCHCNNSFQILPASFHIFEGQRSVVRLLFSVLSILEQLPPEECAVLRQLPKLGTTIRSILNSPVLRAFVEDSTISPDANSGSAARTWQRFCPLDWLALNCKYITRAITTSNFASLDNGQDSVSLYSLRDTCAQTVSDLSHRCALLENRAVKSDVLLRVVKQLKSALDEVYQLQWVNLLPDNLKTLCSCIAPFTEAIEHFWAEASCLVAPLLPNISLVPLADELMYLLGVAEAYTATGRAPRVPELRHNSEAGASVAEASPVKNPVSILPAPIEQGGSIVSLVNYRDRSVWGSNDSVVNSLLSFTLPPPEVSAVVGGDNGTGKSTACLSVLRFFADAQSLLPVSADAASFVPRTSITAFFVESCDTKGARGQHQRRPHGSYDRFLSRVNRVVYEVLPNSARPAILFDDSIRAFTSNSAAQTVSWNLLEHFCKSGFFSFFIQQEPALAEMVKHSTETEPWLRGVTLWGTLIREVSPERFEHFLIRDSIPPPSGEGIESSHGLATNQLATLRGLL